MDTHFQHKTEQFADIKLLRYQVPGFPGLSLQEKRLAYYLSQAAYWGRDIFYDQNYKHNLLLRKVLETLHQRLPEEGALSLLLKQLWVANGLHHHYSTQKFVPKFSEEDFARYIQSVPADVWQASTGLGPAQITERLAPVLFDPQQDARRVCLDAEKDRVQHSACNFYEGVTQTEAEAFYEAVAAETGDEPPSFGLNTKLVKRNGKVHEQVISAHGLYGPAIQKMLPWLQKAADEALNASQEKALRLLVQYYQTGDVRLFDDFNKAWLADPEPAVDFIHGFIEVYGDPLGIKGAYEGLVMVRDPEATGKYGQLGQAAGWFEAHAPFMPAHKKSKPQGIRYNVVHVVAEAGDASPTTPIGINLPNADWMRARYGSKSVSLANIETAYHEVARDDGTLDEFFLPAQAKRIRNYGQLASRLFVGLHEVIGHGSGQLEKGVASPAETLKNYANVIEETRADLVALYFLPDPYLETLGLTDNAPETGRAAYDEYIMNGIMVQLKRIAPGDAIEEAHMRNRQLIAAYAYEKGKARGTIQRISENGNTYFIIADYEALREIFGSLLREVQRIKSQGDYAAAKQLVEHYGVKVDARLHEEVLVRYEKLGIAPYSAFINPELRPVYDKDGQIRDVEIHYPDDFSQQMLAYSKNYAAL